MQAAMHTNDEIEIFSDRVSAKTSDLQDEVALKNSERTGNYGEHVEACPAFAPDQEGAQVFDDLHDFDRALGKAHFLDLIIHDTGAVQDTYDAAYGHDTTGIGEYSCHDADERFFFEN
jgi:hypothetical protein